MEWRVRRLIDNLWGPTGSVLWHVLILLALFKFITTQRKPAEREVEVVIREMETVEKLEDIEQELDQIQDMPTVVDAVAPPTVSLDQEPPPVDALSPQAAGADMSDLNIMEATSPLRFKGLYASRSASGRKDALDKFGGGMGKQTEYAVLKALKWLKDHQELDGSWGTEYKAAMTGLALLTFLAHGETTASEEFGPPIRNGLRFLLKNQKDGYFVGGGPGHPSQVKCYEHAIASYAVGEAYGLTSIPFLKVAMEDATQVIIDGLHEGGSWDYGYRKGPEAVMDVSLSGWHIQALKAAASAGAENRGLKAALESSIRGLKTQADKGAAGLFKYGTRAANKPGDPVMTGVAVLCMQLSGHAVDAEARAGLAALDPLPVRWSKAAPQAPDARGVAEWPFYAWYYITQAKFHQGGKMWINWNKQFAPLICTMQNPDGSWCPAPQSAEGAYGPVYCTALCTLMLEVYYRFLPTYKPIEIDSALDATGGSEEEDVIVKFE